MDLEHVLYERAGDAPVVTITVNRPDKLNALNDRVMAEIDRAFQHAAEDDDCRVVILTGAGPKAFVAGADIAELAEQGVLDGRARAARGQAAFGRIEASRKPVIGMINGYAFGGGLELALACHLRTMAETAKVGLPEVSLGIIPGYGGTQRLRRLVGLGRAVEMVLTGNPIDAPAALAAGLVNRVAPAADLARVTRELADVLLGRGPLALGMALDALYRGADLPLEQGLAVERDLFGVTSATEDMREGMQAFLARRKPAFRGQ